MVCLALCVVAGALAQPAVPTGIQSSGGIDLGRNELKNAAVETVTDTFTGVFDSLDYTNYTPPTSSTVNIQGTTIGPCNILTLDPRTLLTSLGSLPSKLLDAGPMLNLNGPNGTQQIPLSNITRGYFATLGGGAPSPLPNAPAPMPLYPDAGTYTIDNGSGGADVGPFTATLTVPGPLLVWTNADNSLTVDRSAGVDIQWTGGDPSANILIYGVESSPSAVTAFSCTVPNTGELHGDFRCAGVLCRQPQTLEPLVASAHSKFRAPPRRPSARLASTSPSLVSRQITRETSFTSKDDLRNARITDPCGFNF